MIKKTLMSIMVIGITASMIAGTMPFLSDTEKSSGNSFSAGILDLEVNNQNPLDSPVITMSHVEFCYCHGCYKNIILHMTGDSNPAKVKMRIFNVTNHSGYTGCSPGFWKNHPCKWVKYSTEDTIGSVFELPSELQELSSKNLSEALNFRGGNSIVDKAKILLRQAVAALLNAAHPDINYPLSESNVINRVNGALASLDKNVIVNLKNILHYYNNLGCSCCSSSNNLSEHIVIDLKLINTSSGEKHVILPSCEYKTLDEIEGRWVNLTTSDGISELSPRIKYILKASVHPCNICHFYWGASVTFDIEFYAEWNGPGLDDIEESDGNSITVWG